MKRRTQRGAAATETMQDSNRLIQNFGGVAASRQSAAIFGFLGKEYGALPRRRYGVLKEARKSLFSAGIDAERADFQERGCLSRSNTRSFNSRLVTSQAAGLSGLAAGGTPALLSLRHVVVPSHQLA